MPGFGKTDEPARLRKDALLAVVILADADDSTTGYNSAWEECDYRPRDPERFRHVLPSPDATLRLQTVVEGAPPRFRRLLEAFGEASGLPFLVNTSFNGFHEPIVCSPRDAVRVFYGSGIDVLVMPPFVLEK